MKILDKLGIKINKKLFTLFLILIVIGVISGCIFVLILNKNDKITVAEYINNYLSNIENNNINYKQAIINGTLYNFLINIIIWLLGISVIGIPIILFIFFSKAFALGFTITSILINYKYKGILFALIYIFPHKIINLLMLLVLIMYSVIFSYKLIDAFIKKKNIDFKFLTKKYAYILLVTTVIISIMSLYEVFIVPRIIKLIIPIIK